MNKIRKIIFEDTNFDRYIVPKKLKDYYGKGIKPTTDMQLTRLQYLDILEVLVNMNFLLGRKIYLAVKDEQDFQGTGYLGKTKIAFFGKKYGSTKFAIPYKEFRKLNLDEIGILTLNECLIELFEKQIEKD